MTTNAPAEIIGVKFEAPWQPIESAPKDEMPILVLTKEHNNGTEDEPFMILPRIFCAVWNAKGNSWVNGDLEATGTWSSGSGWFQPDEVTHWCPLQGVEGHVKTAIAESL